MRIQPDRVRSLFLVVFFISGFFSSGNLRAATYCDDEALAKRLTALEKQAPNLVRPKLWAKSLEGRKVWLVELGKGTEAQRQTRPAMLVVAGIEGNDLVGSTLTVSWIEGLVASSASDPNTADLLDTTTVYVVCRLNADAARHFFETPRWETALNGRPYDDDRDALVDEDGPEDLNGDGLITAMRVEDKAGRHILDAEEPRLLIEADPLKGEVGRWRYLSEGIDNDGDEQWNEDGLGGVNFNRNFPFDYAFFAPDAGVHAVSEVETRALADFVVTHPNIGIVLTYGRTDNLLKVPDEAKKAPGRGEPLMAIDSADIGCYRALGETYRETLGLDKELEGISEPGTFSDWIYFHRGRLSLAVCPWNPELGMALSKIEAKEESGDDEGDKSEAKKKDKDGDGRGKDAREQLAWFDEHVPEAFRPWQAFDHPDFPGQRVEIGGYSPFALTNPPENGLADLASRHAQFLTDLAGRLPRLALRRGTCRHLGESVFSIEVEIENTGFLPTMLAHGERTREVHPMRAVLDLPSGEILAGRRIAYLPILDGSGGATEVRWTVHVPQAATIDFHVISMLAGRVDGVIDLRNTTVSLREANPTDVTRDNEPK